MLQYFNIMSEHFSTFIMSTGTLSLEIRASYSPSCKSFRNFSNSLCIFDKETLKIDVTYEYRDTKYMDR